MPIGPSILPSQNLAAQYAQTFGNVTKNLGQSRSFLSFKGFKFTLKTGGMAQVLMDKLVNQQGIPVDVPRASVDIVLLNMAPHQHCTYYRNAYVEDSNARPDYVWWYGDPLPDEVPREKVEREGVLRNAYQI
jgi:hypothetical protein